MGLRSLFDINCRRYAVWFRNWQSYSSFDRLTGSRRAADAATRSVTIDMLSPMLHAVSVERKRTRIETHGIQELRWERTVSARIK